MANQHTMRCTALPNGLRKQDSDLLPVVSVHLGFRLVPDKPTGVLSDFPAALAWPTQPLSFELLFRRGSQVVSTVGVPVSAPADAAMWSRIFPATLPVRGIAEPPRKLRRIRTFRNGRLAQRWRDAYVKVAASIGPENDHLPVGTDPTGTPLAGFEAAGFWDDDRSKTFGDASLQQQLEATLASTGYVPHTPPAGMSLDQVARRDLLEFRRFLTRALQPDPADNGAEPGDRPNRVSWVQAPTLDFHQVTTACGAHAGLLRPLGLVVDLVPDTTWAVLSRMLGGEPDAVSVVGNVKLAQGITFEASPWTRCTGGSERFVARPADDGDLGESGFLRLGDTTRYRAEILDVEATTLKAIGTGATIQMRQRRRSRSTPGSETVATMRATGIGIARADRAARVHQRSFQRGDALVEGMRSDPTKVLLDADDVLRGHRLDVRPEKALQWRSLVRRTGELTVADGGKPIELPDGEGWIGDGPVADDAGDLYLGEEQFRWDGWSPVAPKPGRIIDPEDGVADGAPNLLPGLPVVARYRPTPGTLVPLRYGRRYQFRARAVDLAGNSAAVDDPSKPDEISPLVLFGRLDPVGSPDLLMTAPRLPGEELHHVVLRTIRRELDAEGTNSRFVVPPRTTVVEAERHGVLDRPDGRPDPARHADLAARDAYSLHVDGRSQVDPGASDAAAEGAARYVPVAAGYSVDFLPDPLARWLQLRRPDGTSVLPGPFAGRGIPIGGPSWPSDAQPVRVEVKESDSVLVDWHPELRVLVIGLPKAEGLQLRLSSGFDEADLVQFAFADWVARDTVAGASDWPETITKLAASPLGKQILTGRNWTFTPWQPFSVIHAVKDPLKNPQFLDVAAFALGQRPLASTPSSLAIHCRWHGISTGRLDLLASWTEGIDGGPGTAPPRQVNVDVVATELVKAKTPPGPDGMVDTTLRAIHEHGDTKHRQIAYRLEGTGAFLEHFVETREVVFPAGANEIVVDGVDPLGIAMTTVRLSGPASSAPDAAVVTFRREGDVTVDDGAAAAYRLTSTVGQTTATLRRLGSQVPRQVPLRLTFVPNPISHRSNVAPRNVMSSTRPPAPEIHSVIPTFGWNQSTAGRTVTSRRTSAGVRVWLERPWWSSGLGEQLAVLYQAGTTQPSNANARFVTQWGRDPMHPVSNVRDALTATSFPLRSNGPIGLRPPGGPLVQAVPHQVHFDADRDKWYCDIDLALASYWPFVRLALARWQPNTITSPVPGEGSLALSPVVLADIVQVAPGRTVTVTASSGPWGVGAALRVSLQGVAPSGSVDTVVETHIERQRQSNGSDADWEPLTSPTPMLPVSISGPQLEGERRYEGLALILDRTSRVFRYRLVIEEFERFRTDGSSSSSYVETIGPYRVSRPYQRDGRRLVHLDVVPLSGIL